MYIHDNVYVEKPFLGCISTDFDTMVPVMIFTNKNALLLHSCVEIYAAAKMSSEDWRCHYNWSGISICDVFIIMFLSVV